ncbi:hypothetical protein MKX03_028144, partial [Papaver bracteatum]
MSFWGVEIKPAKPFTLPRGKIQITQGQDIAFGLLWLIQRGKVKKSHKQEYQHLKLNTFFFIVLGNHVYQNKGTLEHLLWHCDFSQIMWSWLG